MGFWVLGHLALHAQAFVVHNTGAEMDGEFQASGGVCLMGGSSESDDAMAWFLERAGGGDVLVLRPPVLTATTTSCSTTLGSTFTG